MKNTPHVRTYIAIWVINLKKWDKHHTWHVRGRADRHRGFWWEKLKKRVAWKT